MLIDCDPLKPLQEKMYAALDRLFVVDRRWRKTMLTYFNDNDDQRWAANSVLQRVLDRMQHADEERDEAEDYYYYCRTEVNMFKVYRAARRLARTHPDMPGRALHLEWAANRLKQHRLSYYLNEYRKARPKRDYHDGQISELLVRNIGMAHLRACVDRQLAKELEDPTLRKDRKKMLVWSSSLPREEKRACIFEALREKGECLCRSPEMRSCEMCLGEA